MVIDVKRCVYEVHRAGYSIMVIKDECNGHPCWDIYYKKPNYAYTYAFGLPVRYDGTFDLHDVFNTALKCRTQYDYLFT